MTRVFSTILILACLASTSGCSSAGTTKVLDNLRGCERHYQGTVAGGLLGGQFAGTVEIKCTPASAAQVD